MLGQYPHGGELMAGEDDAFWAAVQEAGVPISIHVAFATAAQGDSSRMRLTGATRFYDAPVRIQQFIDSGVFDRFPDLRLVFVEVDSSWTPYLREQLDDRFLRTAPASPAPIKRLPSEYFADNILTTFITDPYGDAEPQLHRRSTQMMWSSDYPHTGSDWPNSWKTIDEYFDGVPEDDKYCSWQGTHSASTERGNLRGLPHRGATPRGTPMAIITLDPTNGALDAATPLALAPRPASLDGQVLGIIANGLGDSEIMFDALADMLVEHDGVADVVKIVKAGVAVAAVPGAVGPRHLHGNRRGHRVRRLWELQHAQHARRARPRGGRRPRGVPRAHRADPCGQGHGAHRRRARLPDDRRRLPAQPDRGVDEGRSARARRAGRRGRPRAAHAVTRPTRPPSAP